jgi:hypothetical protein
MYVVPPTLLSYCHNVIDSRFPTKLFPVTLIGVPVCVDELFLVTDVEEDFSGIAFALSI